MPTIADQIQRLQNDSSAIASAIEAKGVTVPQGSGFDDYASLIASIPQDGGGGSPLPYTPLEYIQTDGTAYINSGVAVKATMSFDLKVKINSSISSAESFVGSGTTDGNANTIMGLYRSSGNADKIGYGYYYLYATILTPSDLSNPIEVSTRLLKGTCAMGVKVYGGTSYTSATASRNYNVSSSNTLYIFASNNAGSPVRKASAGSRIYYIRIISGGSFPCLAFDGVPCIYNGSYGLWDNVSHSFFGNAAGSGSFTGA